MKKQILKIIFFSLIICLTVYLSGGLKSFLKPKTAFSVADLIIDWGVPSGQPIFVIENFLPGDQETRTVTIENGASLIRLVGVRGIETQDLDNLSDVLDLTISQNGTILYNQTLTKFFTDSLLPDGIFLFNLNHGENKAVKFSVKFEETATNIYQNKKIVFDIKIGLSIPVPTECQKIKLTNIIYGTEKNDIIHGTNANDLIFGLEGNDVINGSNGNDCLIGGDGNDKIDGSNGNDVIFGNEGDDRINGSNGDDFIDAGSGNDIVDGSNGNDKIFGRKGNDKLDGGNNNDYLEGNEGNDILLGGNNNDILLGGSGNDSANGGLGKDKCEAETKTKCEL